MAEDQSVLGRRCIYYDQHGSEALICSDNEEENAEPEIKKHSFSKGEVMILRMALQEYGISGKVLSMLTQFIGGSTSKIQDRYNVLEGKHLEVGKNIKSLDERGSERKLLLEKILSTALDSFDNHFCRRCLEFDFRLRGCSQVLIDVHFEPAKFVMFAICLCVPLVSVRVGKLKKQGTLLCPTSIRFSQSQSVPASQTNGKGNAEGTPDLGKAGGT